MRTAIFLAAAGAAVGVSAIDLASLRPISTARYSNNEDVAADGNTRLLRREDYVETAKELVKSVAPDATFRVIDDHYVGANGFSHVYFYQTADDVDIDGAFFNVNIDRDGHVFSYGNSFFDGNLPAQNPLKKRELFISAVEALGIVRDSLDLPIEISQDAETEAIADEKETYAVTNVGNTNEDPKARLVYLVKPNGEVALTWKVETRVQDTAFSSYVDVDASDVVTVLNHVDSFTYEVYDFPINDPRQGERTVVEDPLDSKASPFGWHAPWTLTRKYWITEGNNVWAGALFANETTPFYHNARSDTGSFEFDYIPDGGEPIDFYAAAVTQTFYIANMLHDLFYLMGFTPAAGNYQIDTNGEGGQGDVIQINVALPGSFNNGNFQQAADGGRGVLTLYLFNHTGPMRDVAFDTGLVIHEITHSMSDRLTGGPATTGCLTAYEPDGMAEGWSDIFAAALTLKPDADRSATYGFAAWPLDLPEGQTARIALYSTDKEVNDLTYSDANGRTKEHEVGTVWATMLYEVLWNLIDKHGKSDASRPEFVDGVPTDGKFLLLQLLIDAFAIQPCNPTFIQARDAIIDADTALTGGANQCEIWQGFAKRGLGAGAVSADMRVDNYDLPSGVC